MSMQQVWRQMPAQAGRVGVARGEAARDPASDEICGPRHDPVNTGSGLLSAALTRENLRQALKRVRANKGAAGVDGLDIDQTARHLVTAWPAIRESLLRGTYRPSPVRRVTIPKPDGGERELGIPTVTDRVIQQALLQVLQPILDPTFSEHSYGFRPGRRAHDAVLVAQSYVQSGRRVVVDVDLEKFFDRVNHDILIDRLRKRIDDAGVIRLIRAYLNSGIMSDGVVLERHQGTPQGGPLSPLLANVMLDEVDKELERRGHCFVRYADDANVYVRSRRAGERVMELLRSLYAQLHLTVNETKSAVASVFGRKFLGFSFWAAPRGEIRCKVAAKPLATFKQRIRQLTGRSGGRSMVEVVERLRHYVLGWKAYFRLAQTPHIWRRLDEWMRHRLRAIQLKHWKRSSAVFRELKALGATRSAARQVAGNSRRWWHNSDRLLKTVLTIAYFDRLRVPRLS
ncbi:MAG: group II intron reverse transcriptase/maturase [Candidatus Accumulibacter sp.]|uniref:RNA-directed DNA polymerase n=1 Tax=Candidatus Accumulibacter appositus TaxID=1454003 RepID=A0A011N328_9PROT|nr:group II intron reverse transcriptase/maturase [Accumulibacter sp.]EXI76918.1 MAG: Group II intron-encoded protein LtrA [Candidatus Accumulibacter appositus]MCB1968317.1 group II intron reverse transcriptase/maturase [Accumulibacter sp.]MCP5247994.1 group II intron reverse transcriptase/maturase [Accumulibacter sp.]HRE95111.1 group II intron reverse transcriptase/maturase [Fimbriimonadaceae bacterium]